MKKIYILILIVFSLLISFLWIRSSTKEDNLQTLLDKEINQKDYYVTEKLNIIRMLIDSLQHTSDTLYSEKYIICKEIFSQYSSFNYDSACLYASQLRKIAAKSNDENLITESRIKYCMLLSRSGFFKEAVDSLLYIYPLNSQLQDTIKADYYITLGRTYHHLADYTNDQNFTVNYKRIGNNYLTESLKHIQDSALYYWISGLKQLKADSLYSAQKLYKYAVSSFEMNDELKSMLYSTLGHICYELKEYDSSKNYFLMSAITDIRNSIKETVALRRLAQIAFYIENDIKHASEYIDLSLDDATLYGSRHKKNVIVSTLPIIMERRLTIIEKEKSLFLSLFIIIMLLGAALAIVLIITLNQSKKLRISEMKLQTLNNRLNEANQIKIKYLGHYLDLSFNSVNRIDRFLFVAKQKIEHKHFDSLLKVVKEFGKENEKDKIYSEFDNTFLTLFPTFVDDFNALLIEEERFLTLGNKTLNPTLRIFALIRLGISDSEQIAKILDYSITTIYNYRTRIKKKAIVDGEKFEEYIMNISF